LWLLEGLVNEEERQEAFRGGMDVVIEEIHQPFRAATNRAMAAYRPAFRQAMSAALFAAESAASGAGHLGRYAASGDQTLQRKEQVGLAQVADRRRDLSGCARLRGGARALISVRLFPGWYAERVTREGNAMSSRTLRCASRRVSGRVNGR